MGRCRDVCRRGDLCSRPRSVGVDYPFRLLVAVSKLYRNKFRSFIQSWPIMENHQMEKKVRIDRDINLIDFKRFSDHLNTQVPTRTMLPTESFSRINLFYTPTQTKCECPYFDLHTLACFSVYFNGIFYKKNISEID